MTKILFVCTGNTCRSAMAQAIFRERLARDGLKQEFRVSSAGLRAQAGEPMSHNSRLALKGLGYKAGAHRAKQFTLDMVKKHDYIIMMTEAHVRSVGNFANVAAFGQYAGADVLDPYGQSLEYYVRTAKQIEGGYEPIMKAILSKHE